MTAMMTILLILYTDELEGDAMKKLLAIVFAAFAFALLGDDVVYQDEDVRRTLSMSCCVIDNSGKINRMRNHALSVQCGNDTNRFARIVCELAHTNNVIMARAMIGLLGTYGSAEHVPFLVSQTTNEVYAARAINSIFRIEGATSNAIAVADVYMSRTNVMNRSRYEVARSVVQHCIFDGQPSSIRQFASQSVLRFMSEDNIYHTWMDQLMIDSDPTYRYSRRRLSVLRAVVARASADPDMTYVTNAINELIAYPGENLPE